MAELYSPDRSYEELQVFHCSFCGINYTQNMKSCLWEVQERVSEGELSILIVNIPYQDKVDLCTSLWNMEEKASFGAH